MNRKVSGRNILITGGAGFIGSNLVESMLKSGDHLVCLDNFSTGKRENINVFMNNPDFLLIEGDIRNYSDCEKSLKGIDYVFHQAALGSVPRSIKDPVTSTDVILWLIRVGRRLEAAVYLPYLGYAPFQVDQAPADAARAAARAAARRRQRASAALASAIANGDAQRAHESAERLARAQRN